MKKIKLNLIMLLALVPLLTFCGGVRDALEGKKRSEQSDEFLVKKKNPLQMPPDMNKLPVPGDDLKKSIQSNEDEVKDLLKINDNDNSKLDRGVISNSGSVCNNFICNIEDAVLATAFVITFIINNPGRIYIL